MKQIELDENIRKAYDKADLIVNDAIKALKKDKTVSKAKFTG